jgi:hypothetical protein
MDRRQFIKSASALAVSVVVPSAVLDDGWRLDKHGNIYNVFVEGNGMAFSELYSFLANEWKTDKETIELIKNGG